MVKFSVCRFDPSTGMLLAGAAMAETLMGTNSFALTDVQSTTCVGRGHVACEFDKVLKRWNDSAAPHLPSPNCPSAGAIHEADIGSRLAPPQLMGEATHPPHRVAPPSAATARFRALQLSRSCAGS